jgi:hypothetical protein
MQWQEDGRAAWAVANSAGAGDAVVANLGAGWCKALATLRQMSKDELVIQLVKIALGVLIAGYFLWWSLEVLKRLPPPQ